MIRPGLCSVTFRQLDPAQVVPVANAAGLEAIEWAGDSHVPAGDTDRAADVGRLTRDAGLAVASYGSYLAFEGTDDETLAEGDAVIAAAQALEAPRIRVWAGRSASAETDPEKRSRQVAQMQRFADRAAEQGIAVGLEFHGGTLTDEIGSTLRLLREIDRDGVRTYWQPHQDMPAPDAVRTLREALPRVSTIHVFSWWPNHQRHPLAERADLWREVFTLLREEGSDRDALLEFVPGDDPAVLAREAATLRSLIAATEGEAR